MSIPPDDLPGMVAWLAREVAELKRRMRNRTREGKVIQEDAGKGLYRVRLRDSDGDEPAYDTGWIRVQSLSAGQVKIQAEPVVGQWVTVTSESGDLTDAVIGLSSFNDDNRRPHDKSGELKITMGADAFTLLVDKDGVVTTKAKSRAYNTDQDVAHTTGGNVTHATTGDVNFNTGGIVRFA